MISQVLDPSRSSLTLMHVQIIGCGYLGLRAARGWTGTHRVSALTRSPDRAREWERTGIEPVLGDLMQPDSLRQLPDCDLCLYAVGHDRNSPHSKHAVYLDGLRHVLTEYRSREASSGTTKLPRLIYISSSSVYGQEQGELVNEDSACTPTTEGGQICLAAEQVVREFYPVGNSVSSNRATILRLSGIYGPGRLIGRIDQLRQGIPQGANPDAWLNLIHVDDAAQAIWKLAAAPSAEDLYLLSDERPLRRREFYEALAAAVQAPPPRFAEAAESPVNKRCDSRRIREQLNLQLTWPNALDALPQLLAEMTAL
ncbi:SDR family oxidoreductase [Planctomicrobium sp. SH664]|uniref:SDR family oxidoreductase n=1 Tax=Planctomicrobium sp. SH664 TaxID=3448125 RepID=UPI003F5C8975